LFSHGFNLAAGIFTGRGQDVTPLGFDVGQTALNLLLALLGGGAFGFGLVAQGPGSFGLGINFGQHGLNLAGILTN
jgi:hypothetical protein